ncbi:sulfonate ABC transporter substrate-binding protein [Glutamicibacter uratoxydans]|uniref:Sulfonate ABC transporter substrate-binding protein n=2 Tax=Glutamicibacter uratoxydans TaxID=43667 RepID=A0A4Y4DP64_GLUUR|nr:sulfonate ABC transporter substrate-binding protein [Glutamicibacter uratoxydans]
MKRPEKPAGQAQAQEQTGETAAAAGAGRIRLSAKAAGGSRRGRAIGLVLAGLLASTAVLTAFVPAPNKAATASADQGPAATLRLGYFANVTHAPALVAQSEGFLGNELKAGGTGLETQIFNAGPAAIEALNSGALDAAYLGPSPALNSYLSSKGTSLKIVAGVASGGASLVTTKDITTVEQLEGANLATPQFGGTQDVALRSFLKANGLEGKTTVTPSSNGTVPQLFARGAIDGAWLPEPHASLLVQKYGAHRLVDESTLWDEGKFPTTVLVVSQKFIAQHPQTVQELVDANAQAINWLNTAEDATRLAAVQKALKQASGSSLDDKVIASALKEVSFDQQPLNKTFDQLVQNAVSVGIGEPGDTAGLVDESFIRSEGGN